MFDEIQLIDAQYEHFEQMRDDALAWELDFRQLGRGENGHRLVQAVGPDFHYIYTVFRSPYDQRSASPLHLRTFSILAEERSASSWCGHDFDLETLVLFAKGDEFRAVSQGYFSNHVFSLPEDLLEQIAESVFEVTWSTLSTGKETAVVTLPAGKMAPLRRTLETLALSITSSPTQAAYKELVSQLAVQLIDAFLSRTAASPTRAAINRRKYFLEAQDYIDSEIDTPIVLDSVCKAVGAGHRTLQYVFRECAGLTPKGYISRQRLARFHQALIEHDNRTRIVDLANQLGYWHMGQLAKDYCSIYGTTPRESLLRC